MTEPKGDSTPVEYMCDACTLGACHRCSGCTCADDNHGGLIAPDPPYKDSSTTPTLA